MPPIDQNQNFGREAGTATERVTETTPQGKILKNEAGETRLVAYGAPVPIGWHEATGVEIGDHVSMLLDNGKLDDVVNEFLGYTG